MARDRHFPPIPPASERRHPSTRSVIRVRRASEDFFAELVTTEVPRGRLRRVLTTVLRPFLFVLAEGYVIPGEGRFVARVQRRSDGAVVLEHAWGEDDFVAASSDLEVLNRDLAALTPEEFLAEYDVSS
jgi:hypothetical protein